MEKNSVWEIMFETMRSLNSHYVSDMDEAAKSIGLDPSVGHLIIPALMFEPDPISAERLRMRMPYVAPILYEERLQSLHDAGFFTEAPARGYYLSERGHEAFNLIVLAAYKKMDSLSEKLADGTENAVQLLARLVESAMVSSDPISKWSIINSRRLDKDPDASDVVKIDQYMSDLAAFRDDAHLASWRQHQISAHAWEILGVIWREQAQDFESVIQTLKMRRWREEDTKRAVNLLVDKGWIDGEKGYRLTEKGREVREAAEELTDRYFFSPWEVLSESELDRLGELIKKMHERLEKITE